MASNQIHSNHIWILCLKNIIILIALLCDIIAATIKSEVVFEAAFQGECRSNGPCQQLCFDLHDGTFECACKHGFTLEDNGYSCIENHMYEKSKKKDRNGSKIIKKMLRFSSKTNRNQLLVESEKYKYMSQENPVYYSCSDIECEAGGVCVMDETRSDKRIRCKCPLGRGGFYCEKPMEIRFPRFRGSSYLALPTLRDAHKSMHIIIEFRPEHYDGVLLYSGEKQTLDGDFIAIVIIQGIAEFRFDCGMGFGAIRSDMPVVLNSWNTLTIYRDGWTAWMQLNQGKQVTGQSKGLFSRITFRLETFLGGSPNISQISRRVITKNGFFGCVRSLEINGRSYDFRSDNRGDTIDGVDIDMCSTDVCSKIYCFNEGQCMAISPEQAICLCPLGYSGDYCELEIDFIMPSFNGSSYLQFAGIGDNALSFIEIEIIFKPRSPNGLFLYNGNRMDSNSDFISLNLVNGYVEFGFDLGSGATFIRSANQISMNEWHTVVISRTGREATLKVDNSEQIVSDSIGAFSQLSLSLNLFIGGVLDLKDVEHNVFVTDMLNGCIQKLVINNRQISLRDEALSGVNVVNCAHQCTNQPCLKEAYCEPILESYRCHCPLNFYGNNCEKDTLIFRV